MNPLTLRMSQLELDQQPACEGSKDPKKQDDDDPRDNADNGQTGRKTQHAVRDDFGNHESGHELPAHGPVLDLVVLQRVALEFSQNILYLAYLSALLVAKNILGGIILASGCGRHPVAVLKFRLGLVALPLKVGHDHYTRCSSKRERERKQTAMELTREEKAGGGIFTAVVR